MTSPRVCQAIYQVLLTLHPDTASRPILAQVDPFDALAPDILKLDAATQRVMDEPVYQEIVSLVQTVDQSLKFSPGPGAMAETEHNKLLGFVAA